MNDLQQLTLVDGLSIRQGDSDVVYKSVTLRESTVADEIKAAELAQQVGELNGRVVFAPNTDIYTHAMTMLCIVEFSGQGLEPLPAHAINLQTFGRLSRGDVSLIEERMQLIELSAQVRFGLITQQELDAALAESLGDEREAAQSKQPAGQDTELGEPDHSNGGQPVLEYVVDRTAEYSQVPAAADSAENGANG